MIVLVKANINTIREICDKHSVAELYLYGSAVKGPYGEKSDLDFAVVFKQSLSPLEHGDAFFALLDALKALFNRPIDLVTYRALKNPIFIEELNNSMVSLYAA